MSITDLYGSGSTGPAWWKQVPLLWYFLVIVAIAFGWQAWEARTERVERIASSSSRFVVQRFGMHGSGVLRMDRQTGATWVLSGGQWVAVNEAVPFDPDAFLAETPE